MRECALGPFSLPPLPIHPSVPSSFLPCALEQSLSILQPQPQPVTRHNPKYKLSALPWVASIPAPAHIKPLVCLECINQSVSVRGVILDGVQTNVLFSKLFILMCLQMSYFYFSRMYLFIFREKGKEGRKRGRETSMCGCLSLPLTGDLACNPDMCPDWESNW